MSSPNRDQQETLAYLEHEGPRWVSLRDRCERTNNLDRELVNQRDWAMERINHLLEDLYAQTVMLNVETSHEVAA